MPARSGAGRSADMWATTLPLGFTVLVLIHHADAVGPELDPQRPLSSRGHDQVERLVARLSAEQARRPELGAWRPAAIWHSGKLRARQTAEAFLAFNPFAEFKMMRGLRPDDPPELLVATLTGEDRDLAIVSHMSLLPALRAQLSGGQGFPLHGLLVLDLVDTGWQEYLALEAEL